VTEYVQVAIGDLFQAKSGQPKYIRDYVDAHPGNFPVYSASLAHPFGKVDTFDYQGAHLTWVMNGYGGRVQEASDQFSATRDRGVFVPRQGIEIPDLTYLRFAMEPQLVAAAVGRRVDGRRNEYTKVYPDTAESVAISLPVTPFGAMDHSRMREIGTRLRRIELAQRTVKQAQEPLTRASFTIPLTERAVTLSLGDTNRLTLTIGERVLRAEHTDTGVPVYSANALVPFGSIATSNLQNFDRPSLLWGIDGVFDWNLLPAGVEFATTDHCGRLQVLDEDIDVEYVYWYLRSTRERYGFDRVFRASLGNMKSVVQVAVPTRSDGVASVTRQKELAAEFRRAETARIDSIAALDNVLQARVTVEL
jgi:hypothetical protein